MKEKKMVMCVDCDINGACEKCLLPSPEYPTGDGCMTYIDGRDAMFGTPHLGYMPRRPNEA